MSSTPRLVQYFPNLRFFIQKTKDRAGHAWRTFDFALVQRSLGILVAATSMLRTLNPPLHSSATHAFVSFCSYDKSVFSLWSLFAFLAFQRAFETHAFREATTRT